MNKIYLCTILMIAIMFIPVNITHADSGTDTKQVLIEQLTALVSYLKHTFNIADYQTPLSNSKMRDIIVEGTEWLVASQEENGHFAYEYAPYEDEYLDDDNIVRQAGALYALGEVVRRDKDRNVEVSESIESSVEFFEGISREDSDEGETFRCIIRRDSSITCKLGATSLALSGLLGYIDAYPEKADEYSDLIESYVTYIMLAKKPDTGFRDEYRIGLGFRGQRESSFSNGEALLALVRYYQYNQREDVKDIIDDTFEYLSNEEFDTSLYLWAMAAIKDMNVIWPNEAYVSYARDFTAWRMGRIVQYKDTKKNYCASTEGFVSAYSALEGSSTSAELSLLRDEIDYWNKKNDRLQIGAIDTHRFVVNDEESRFEVIKDMKQAKGGFLTSDVILTQRIDFTQHCVSTYIQTLVDIEGKTL